MHDTPEKETAYTALEYRLKVVDLANVQMGRMYRQLKEERDELQQQNKQLIEALTFYADEEKHRMKHRGKMPGYRMDVSTDVAEDNGYKARTVLQQIQGKDDER